MTGPSYIGGGHQVQLRTSICSSSRPLVKESCLAPVFPFQI